MKTRLGFVSNSSSSSFLIGIGATTDPENIEKLRVLENKVSDIQVISVGEVLSEGYNDWYCSYICNTDTLELESFTSQSVSLENIKDLYATNSDAVIVIMDHETGDDSDFWDEDNSYYDYDIEIDFFSEEILASLKECGDLCEGFEWGYGAGRDG